jgi:dTDP-3-amino-3,4,6-trideoxy-alpha-D-glucose transaminase
MSIPVVDLLAAHAELGEGLEAAAVRVLRSGRYVDGPELAAFEQEFATFCGSSGAVGTASGFDALRLILEALTIGRGDEVVVSAHTAVATWLAVAAAGARPVPVETDPTTLLIDGSRIEAALTERTAAILVVHMHGFPVDIEPIAEIARRRHLALIEDASQAHGASYRGRRVGSLADAGAFSLYPTKNLGGWGDGGIVTAADDRLLERVRVLGRYGAPRSGIAERLGSNSRLDELQAALLRVKLRVLDSWNERRRTLAAHYRESLSGLSGLTFPVPSRGSEPVWHHLVVRLEERERVRTALHAVGIDTLVHYPVPPHRTPAFAELQLGPLAATERLAEEVLSLPMGPHLAVVDCGRVCEVITSTLRART